MVLSKECASKEQAMFLEKFIKRMKRRNLYRDEYFDQDLYDERYAVERTNAWMGSYRSLLNRFDTTVESWKGFNYLEFMAIALKKNQKKRNKKV